MEVFKDMFEGGEDFEDEELSSSFVIGIQGVVSDRNIYSFIVGLDRGYAKLHKSLPHPLHWRNVGINGRYFISEGMIANNLECLENLAEDICFDEIDGEIKDFDNIFEYLQSEAEGYFEDYTAQHVSGLYDYDDLSPFILDKLKILDDSRRKNDFIGEKIVEEELRFLLCPKYEKEVVNMIKALELECLECSKLIVNYANKIEADCLEDLGNKKHWEEVVRAGDRKAWSKWDIPIIEGYSSKD